LNNNHIAILLGRPQAEHRPSWTSPFIDSGL
jgi:hypothetical protein